KIKAQNSINRINSEQADLRNAIEQQCWNIQKMYGAEFADAVIGFRNKTKSLCDQCIKCSSTLVKENVLSIEELRIMYQVSFSKEATNDANYKRVTISQINPLDTNELLCTVIVGKSDTPIGTFIEYLKASDWIKTGVGYARKVPGICPYCQQSLPQNIQ